MNLISIQFKLTIDFCQKIRLISKLIRSRIDIFEFEPISPVK